MGRSWHPNDRQAPPHGQEHGTCSPSPGIPVEPSEQESDQVHPALRSVHLRLWPAMWRTVSVGTTRATAHMIRPVLRCRCVRVYGVCVCACARVRVLPSSQGSYVLRVCVCVYARAAYVASSGLSKY
eukprot:TRINITY_DN738_c0_g1_i5.p3 TRINITY_DN738_c0_g1~~TRINITY_DN738_c0_g1_i5.p3  ORF type:complete len:127 (+),score=7.48 TRINITY_DN738_c0_g1_i5:319-699(+)